MEYGKFIEIKKVDAAKFMFICKAVSTDEIRFFMNFIYCEDNKLISTDGRRLHILELGDNPYGFNDKTFYKALKMSAKTVWIAEITSEMGTFPNYKRIIPKGDNTTIKFQMNSGTYNKNLNYINIAKLIREISEKFAINFAFLEDLVKNVEWKVQISEGQKAFKFIHEDLTAVIMPMDAT